MDDTAALIQRMYDEAAQCDVFGITKPAALLREAADALQHAANLQAMDEFAEVVTAGHLRDAEALTPDQIGALEAGCGHSVLPWDARVSLVRATERAHGIGHPKMPILLPDEPAAPDAGVVAALKQARNALQKTMGAWGGTCAWHKDVKAAIAAIDAAPKA